MRHESNIKDYSEELIHSGEYFSGIFKKTEGVVSAVFFVLEDKKDSYGEALLPEVKKTALEALFVASDMLEKRREEVHKQAIHLAKTLTVLSSLLNILVAAEQLQGAYGSMITEEIRSIIKNLEDYRHKRSPRVLMDLGNAAPATKEAHSVESALSPIGSRRVTPQKDTIPQKDRKQRIKDILTEKGTISIRDISTRISGTSEKSIQRDLNEMIQSGEVQRHGERRWSLYSLTSLPSGGS